MNKKQKRKEIAICSSLVVLFILTLINTIKQIAIFNIFNISLEYEAQRELYLELFSIQATVATLSVSIIAIITGVQKKDIFGIPITRYVSYLRPKLFKHPYLMIADIIITGINYIVVSFELYNISIFIFIISLTISAILITDISIIYKRNAEIKNEIKEYIFENYNEGIIDDLSYSIDSNCNANNTLDLSSNLEMILEVYKKEVSTNNSSNISKRIEKIFSDKFNAYYNTQNIDIPITLLKYINSIYETANCQDNTIALNIWDHTLESILAFFTIIGPQRLHNFEDFNLITFSNNVINNCIYSENKQQNSFRIEYFSAWSYYYLRKHYNGEITNNDDLAYFKERLFTDSYYNIASKSISEEKKNIYINQFTSLLRVLLETGEVEFLYKNFIKRINYNNNNDIFVYSYILLTLYSYYLGYCEYLVKDKPEEKYGRELLSKISEKLKNTLYYIDFKKILPTYYKRLKKQLMSWEKYENMEFKSVITESVAEKIIHILLCEKYYSEDEIYECLKNINDYNASSVMLKYFSNSDNDEMFDDISLKLFDKSIRHEKLDFLKSAVFKRYKDEQIEQGLKNAISNESLNRFENLLLEAVSRHSNELETNFHYIPEAQSITTSHITIVDLGFIDYYSINNDSLENYIDEHVLYSIYRVFFNTTLPKIKLKKINYEEKSKQKTLIELSKNYKYNLVIGNKQTFWDEEDKDLLERYLVDIKRIKCPIGDQLILLIDSESLYFRISNVVVKSRDVDKDDFSSLDIDECEDNKYSYNHSSNVQKVEYEEQELIDHLHRTMKAIEISADVSFSFKNDENVGCGINIVFEDNENNDTNN